jgi:hypothetical protein
VRVDGGQVGQGLHTDYATSVSKWLSTVSMSHMNNTQRIEVMSFESYLGAHRAMREDFVPVVSPLFNFARDRSQRLPAEKAFPVSVEAMTLMEAKYHLSRNGLQLYTGLGSRAEGLGVRVRGLGFRV